MEKFPSRPRLGIDYKDLDEDQKLSVDWNKPYSIDGQDKKKLLRFLWKKPNNFMEHNNNFQSYKIRAHYYENQK